MKPNKLNEIDEELLRQELERRKSIKDREKKAREEEKEKIELRELECLLSHSPEEINKKLFCKEHCLVDNPPAKIYLNPPILKNIPKSNRAEFREFLKKNRRETINRMLFENGLINSDFLLHSLPLHSAKIEKYLKPESVYEVTEILIKNKETELLSGIHNPNVDNSLLYDKNGFSLPFQISPEGKIRNDHSFTFNYTIDCAKNQQTKDELKEIMDKRIRDLFFNKGLENTHWLLSFLEDLSKGEIILRKNGIIGKELLKKLECYSDWKDKFSKDVDELNSCLYNTQFEQQGKILQFISQNPKPYTKYIYRLITPEKEKKEYHYSGSHDWGGGGGIGFSGSNGGPVGNLEKISNKELIEE